MRPVKTGLRGCLDDGPDHLRYPLQLLKRGLIDDTNAEDDSALKHALVVADAAAQQVCVGNNNLLAAQAPHAGGLDADLLDGAQCVTGDNKISDRERLVEHNSDRVEDVGENALQRKSDGDTADTQGGD